MTVCLVELSTLLSTAAASCFSLSVVLHCLYVTNYYANSEYVGYLQPVVANLQELIFV